MTMSYNETGTLTAAELEHVAATVIVFEMSVMSPLIAMRRPITMAPDSEEIDVYAITVPASDEASPKLAEDPT